MTSNGVPDGLRGRCRFRHELQGLAGVHTFDKGYLLGPFDDGIRNFVKDRLAHVAGHGGPRWERGHILP